MEANKVLKFGECVLLVAWGLGASQCPQRFFGYLHCRQCVVGQESNTVRRWQMYWTQEHTTSFRLCFPRLQHIEFHPPLCGGWRALRDAPLRSNLKLFRKLCLHPKNAAPVRRHFCCSVICRFRQKPSEGGLPLRGWCRPWRCSPQSGRCRPFGFRGWRGCQPPTGWWACQGIASGS